MNSFNKFLVEKQSYLTTFSLAHTTPNQFSQQH